jgi:predicted ABC-type ATPase
LSKSRKPNVYIIAGPNGAGKTTFAKEFLPLYAKCKHFVNADLIAQGISPFAPQSAAMKAGRLLLEELKLLADKKEDFAFESTLAGKTYTTFLQDLKAKGYVIHIFYLWIPAVNLALLRIKERVAQGGHHVPAMDVRRRFKKSLGNFWNLYRPLAEYWRLFDNSFMLPSLIVEGKGDIMEVSDKELFKVICKNGASDGKN